MSKSRHRKRNPQSKQGNRPPRPVPVQPPPADVVEPPAVAHTRDLLPARIPPQGMTVVPAELMAQVQRQWIWFVILAGLALLLAVTSIFGWGLYIRAAGKPAVSPEELAGLRQKAGTLEQKVTDLETRLTEANQARTTAEARLASVSDMLSADRSRLTDAERARADAEAKLTAAEQIRADLASKLEAADKARSEAESRLVELQKSVEVFERQAEQYKADAETHRREAMAAVEGERKARQALQEALAGQSAPEAGLKVVARPAASAPSREGAPAPTSMPAAAAVDAGRHSHRDVEMHTPASQPAPLAEGTRIAVRVGRVPNAAGSAKDDDVLDPQTAAAPHSELLAWGEAMIVAEHPTRGVALIRAAIEKGREEIKKGGQWSAYQKALGWALLRAGREAEARAVLESALEGFEDWAASANRATPDHWTAAFLLGRVTAEDYIRRWTKDDKYGGRLACLPWFYVGQRREMEGDHVEAMNAYRVCVELGQSPGAYPIWRWAEQRLRDLEQKSAASQPAK